MTLTLIVAMTVDGIIGVDNRLPWRLPADLQRFKQLTMGHHMIMGRRTWDSIGRPLPGRSSVVVTRRRDLALPAGVVVAHSLDEAIAACASDATPFVIGGAELYRESLPHAQVVEATIIEQPFAGDTRFPDVDAAHWNRQLLSHHSDGEFPYRFERWQRRSIG